MPMLPIQSLLPLLLFTLLMFAAALYGLAALGHFPRSTRDPSAVILWGSIAAVALSIGIAAVAAWWLIPWYAAIIAAGVAILVAPLMLQHLSDGFVDGWRALTCFSSAALALAVALIVQMAR
jgi:hypothetical protein